MVVKLPAIRIISLLSCCLLGVLARATTPISAVSLQITPVGQVAQGAQVSLTATATGGVVPDYKFYAIYPTTGGNQQELIRDYAAAATCTWTPARVTTYIVVACAREHGKTVNYDAYTSVNGYRVIANPALTAFSPLSGTVGTRITLTGTAFTGATAVKFNGIAATTFTVGSVTTLTATVPTGATTGKISVTTPGGTTTSAANFTVNPPISAVSLQITPASQVAQGASVSLSATATGGAVPDYKFYAVYPTTSGNQQELIRDYAAGATCSWTPARVTTYIVVACAREHGKTVNYDAYTSVNGYRVIANPTLTAFAPLSGTVGTVVTLTGTALIGATAVKFNGVAATSFTVVNATTISATVPAGATTGKISVTTPGGTASSAANFTVNPPISAVSLQITPAGQVAQGAAVSLSATATGGAVPDYKFYAIYPTTGGNQQELIRDYAAAATCTWTPARVTTYIVVACAREHGKTVNYDAYTSVNGYRVIANPTLTSFTPSSGPVGTRVTLTGTAFTGATAVKFNGIAATTFSVGSMTAITATVPTGATTGKISVTTPGGTATSATDFTVTGSTPLDTADYLPQHVGDTWLFNFAYASGYAKDQREVIGATTTFHNNTVTPLNCSYLYTGGAIDNWTEYRLLTATGYFAYGMWDPDESTADPNDGEEIYINPPVCVVPKNVTVGATYTASSSGMTMTVKVVSRGTVTVPAGTFTDVLRVEVTFTGATAPHGWTWWLARNVGPVKKEGFEDNGTPTFLELRYANINGQIYGSQARN